MHPLVPAGSARMAAAAAGGGRVPVRAGRDECDKY